jgi:hypothetical protein
MKKNVSIIKSETFRLQVFIASIIIIPLMALSSIIIFFGPAIIGAVIYRIRAKSSIKPLWFYFALAAIGSAAGNAIFFLKNIHLEALEATVVIFGMDIIAFIFGYWWKYVQDN